MDASMNAVRRAIRLRLRDRLAVVVLERRQIEEGAAPLLLDDLIAGLHFDLFPRRGGRDELLGKELDIGLRKNAVLVRRARVGKKRCAVVRTVSGGAGVSEAHRAL